MIAPSPLTPPPQIQALRVKAGLPAARLFSDVATACVLPSDAAATFVGSEVLEFTVPPCELPPCELPFSVDKDAPCPCVSIEASDPSLVLVGVVAPFCA